MHYLLHLVNTSSLGKSYNISITHQSEFELLDVAEIHQSQQTVEGTLTVFQIAKDLFNEPYSQVIYSLIFQATVQFVNYPTHLVKWCNFEKQ